MACSAATKNYNKFTILQVFHGITELYKSLTKRQTSSLHNCGTLSEITQA